MYSKVFPDGRAVLLQYLGAVLDAVCIFAAGVLAWFLLFVFRDFLERSWAYFFELYSLPIVFAAVMTAVVQSWFDGYQKLRYTSLWQQIRLAWLSWTVVLALILLLAFAAQYGKAYSRTWVLSWFVASLVLLVLVRILLRLLLVWLRRSGFDHKRVVLVGSGDTVARVLAHVRQHAWAGFDIVGIYSDDLASGTLLRGVRVCGAMSDITAADISGARAQQVWLALPLSQEDRIRDTLACLRYSTVDICFIPDIFDLQLLNCVATDIAGLPVLNLTVTPMLGVQGVVKGLQDRILGTLLLILVMPLLLLIAIAIKLDSKGPILFRQRRMGWDGRSFEVNKFRTMYVHHEPMNQLRQAVKGDPRVTALGAFLRRSSLDELPQLFNVVCGQMSLVGPRPHAMVHDQMYREVVNRYTLRHKVKPGITGWAQIHGLRGETETLEKMQMRVEYDLYYIRNYSLWLDIKILAYTACILFRSKNAY